MSTSHRASLVRTDLPASKPAFALVIALALMAVILLLLVSLTTFVQIETQSASQLQKQTIARQNALLGMQIALAKLQLTTGPDDRITATAGILLDDTPTDGVRHWVGVWESRQEGGRANSFLSWLISAPQAVAEAENLPLNLATIPPTDWVTLVGAGSADLGDTDLDNEVRVPKVVIDDSDGAPVGHFAFWVSDEASKARIDLVSNDDSPTSIGIPRTTGLPLIDRPLFSFLTDEATPGGFLSRINDLSDLAFYGENSPVATIPRRYIHDLTTVSSGLLTNTRTGGMRKDLTHLLHNNTAFSREFGNGEHESGWDDGVGGKPSFIFQPSVDKWQSPATIDFASVGAPNWGILRSFYNLHTDATMGANDIYPLHYRRNHGQSTPNVAYHRRTAYHSDSSVSPVISWYQLGIGIEYLKDTDNIWYPRVTLRPVLALYNPYDIPLRASSFRIESTFFPQITLQLGTNDPVSFRFQEVVEPYGNVGSRSSRIRFELTDVDFLPGETRYFTLSEPVHLDHSERLSNLDSSWSSRGGYYVYPTRDGHVVTAAQEGPVNGAPDTPQGQSVPAFGLTDTEKTRMEWTEVPGEALPPIAVTINYSPNLPGQTDGEFRLYLLSGEDVPSLNIARSMQFQYILNLMNDGGDYSFVNEEAIVFEFIDDINDSPTVGGDFGFGLRTTTEAHRQGADWSGLDSDGDRDSAHRLFIDANLRASNLSAPLDGFINGQGLPLASGWVGRGFHGHSHSIPPQFAEHSPYSERYSGYFGSSRTVGTGSTSTVLFHVPRGPISSLGTFQHAQLGRYSHQPAYIFGNSYIPARIALDSVAEGRMIDWSYIINQAVWDDYYFSTVPQDLTAEQLQDYLQGNRVLSNPRLRFHIPDWITSPTSPIHERVIDANDENTAQLVAALQTIEGPFNVNSTSEAAWRAFLGSPSNLQVPVYSLSSPGSGAPKSESETIFYRTPINYNGPFDTADGDSTFWSAYRRLSDDEIHDLAKAMVEEVRKRGPFSSISDFVNRRLDGEEDDFKRRGPLQAALDRSINNQLSESIVGAEKGEELTIPNMETTATFSSEDRPGTGAPGWILQGDVLQVLGPLLAVRSDTFTIRAYGDTINPVTGSIEGQAWCEAVVQRLPDPVMENGDLPTVNELLNPSSPMGRRYQILSFRWLSQNEI